MIEEQRGFKNIKKESVKMGEVEDLVNDEGEDDFIFRD